jgi:hypothetical protein
VHCVKLLGLVLGNFKHLHGENPKALLLELLNNVADGIPANSVWLDNGQRTLQSFHSFVVARSSLVVCR